MCDPMRSVFRPGTPSRERRPTTVATGLGHASAPAANTRPSTGSAALRWAFPKVGPAQKVNLPEHRSNSSDIGLARCPASKDHHAA